MDAKDINLLSNKDIPESVRAEIASQILGASDRAAQREIEAKRLAQDRQKLLWNTPLVAALAGLLTLTATFVFDRLTARDDTSNSITLEQVRNELEQSVARLTQELETAASENLAKLEAEAREREFQYEIVRTELANADKSNADRASVLLFLVRAGVLSSLNEDELRAMAEEQRDNPGSIIVPQLSSGSVRLDSLGVNRLEVNGDLRPPTNQFLINTFGMPRETLSDQCEAPTNDVLVSQLVLKDVGGFRVRMIAPAAESLAEILLQISQENPELSERLGTAGSLCVRRVRGSENRLSNHSFGTAIDIITGGTLDRFGDEVVDADLLRIAPFFIENGWVWGAGFAREDAMHFEVSEQLLRTWLSEGKLVSVN